MSEKNPAASIDRALRVPAPVNTHGSPPGVYWYQIGTVRGPRDAPRLTDSVAVRGSARNRSRSALMLVLLSGVVIGCALFRRGGAVADRRSAGQTVRSATFTRVAEASAARIVSLETGAPGVLVNCSHDTVG